MFNVKKAIAGLTTSLLIAAGLMAVTPLAASAGNSDICTFYRQDGTQASKPTPLEVPFNTKAAATTGVTLRLLSDPNFAINTASSFNANYLGIKLDSGSGVNDPYIQVSGFTGNITLHDGLSSSAEQATPAAGSGSVAYFLMKATTASSNPQGYTVTVWDGDPSNGGSQVCHVGDNTSTSDSRYERVVDTISAQANKVNSVAISVVDALRSNTVAPLGIGNFAKVVVQGDTGTIGSGQKTSRTTYANKGAITLAPAPNASFPDDAWSLEGVDVIITQKGAASPLGLINGGSDYLRYLYMDTAATCGGGAGCSYTATYYYKAKQVFNTRVLVTPIQYISSGTQTKKTGSYPTGTNLPDFEPPAITSPDTANLEKNGVPNTTLTFNPQVKSDLQLVGACLGAQGFTPDANPSGPCTTYYDSSKGNWDIVYDPVSGNYSATFLGDPSFLEGTSYADFVIYNKYYDGNNWIVQVSNVVHLIAHISQGLAVNDIYDKTPLDVAKTVQLASTGAGKNFDYVSAFAGTINAYCVRTPLDIDPTATWKCSSLAGSSIDVPTSMGGTAHVSNAGLITLTPRSTYYGQYERVDFKISAQNVEKWATVYIDVYAGITAQNFSINSNVNHDATDGDTDNLTQDLPAWAEPAPVTVPRVTKYEFATIAAGDVCLFELATPANKVCPQAIDLINNPTGTSLGLTIASGKGTWYIDANHLVTFVPATGQYGTADVPFESVGYSVTDDYGQTATAQIDAYVTPFAAPVTNDIIINAKRDEAKSRDFTSSWLSESASTDVVIDGNQSDPSRDQIATLCLYIDSDVAPTDPGIPYSICASDTTPSYTDSYGNVWTITVVGGVYTVTVDPDPNYVGGTAKIKYIVTDTIGQTSSSWITYHTHDYANPIVTNVTLPTVTTPSTSSQVLDTSTTYSLNSVVTTCPSDAFCVDEADLMGNLYFTINNGTTYTDGAKGTWSISYVLNQYIVQFVPNGSWIGTTSIDYSLTTQAGLSPLSSAHFTVTVQMAGGGGGGGGGGGANEPPTVQGGSGSAAVNNSVTVDPKASAPMGVQELCLIDPATGFHSNSVTIPAVGTFVLNLSGTVTFTPVTGWTGSKSVTVCITDIYGQSASGTVTATINAPSNPPTVDGGNKTVPPGGSGTIDPGVNGATELCLIDPADQGCKQEVDIPNVGKFKILPGGLVEFTADPTWTGTYQIILRAKNAAGQTSTGPINVAVNAGRAPVVKTIAGFAPGSAALNATIKSEISHFLTQYVSKKYKYLRCTGYTMGPTVLPTDKKLSLSRAKNACTFIKSLATGKKYNFKALANATETTTGGHIRRITITLSDK